MDGNRRYARQNKMTVSDGHSDGFLALKRMLEICLKLHIQCVSVYSFAIDNFKRPPEEVGPLMELARAKLLELCKHGDLLQQYDVRLNVLGDAALLPPDVQQAVSLAEDLTKNHKSAILNVCMPYASRHEMTMAIQSAVRKCSIEGSDPNDISEDDIDSQLFTSLRGSPPLDILLRTSGVKRLSDFLLWQCCEDTLIHFTPTYWPHVGLRDFLPVLLDYQLKMWSKHPHSDKPRPSLTNAAVVLLPIAVIAVSTFIYIH